MLRGGGSLFAFKGAQNAVPGLANPAKAPKTPLQGQRNAVWLPKAPFQGQQIALLASKMPFWCLQNGICSSNASLRCSKTIQNFCKCAFTAVLTKPSSMDIDGSTLVYNISVRCFGARGDCTDHSSAFFLPGRPERRSRANLTPCGHPKRRLRQAKIDFFNVFFRCIFRMRLNIDFGSFFGRSGPEK